MERKLTKNPARALEMAIEKGNAAATRNPKAALAATAELINFATTGNGIKLAQKVRGLNLGKEGEVVMVIPKTKTRTKIKTKNKTKTKNRTEIKT